MSRATDGLRARLPPAEAMLAVGTRAVQAMGMLLAVLVAARVLDGAELGYLFVFLSLAAWLQLGDFGIAYAAMQVASHLAARGEIAHLATLRREALRRQRFLASIAAAGNTVLGAIVLGSWTDTGGVPSWLWPWLALVLAVTAAQFENLRIALVEGGESASKAWLVRLLQELAGSLALVAGLWLGAGLWSVAALSASRALAGWSARSLFMRRAAAPPHEGAVSALDWRREVWPFQWKIGLSALSGFLIFQALNPVVMFEQGPRVAAEIGLGLAMMNMALMCTSVWPLSQAARYGRGLQLRDYPGVKRDFRRTTIWSTALAVVTAISACALFSLLSRAGVFKALLPAQATVTLALFLATAVVHHVVMCVAVLLRANRQDPLLPASILGGAFNLVAVWIAARLGSAEQVALVNLICAGIGIPIAFAYYRRLARTWAPGALSGP